MPYNSSLSESLEQEILMGALAWEKLESPPSPVHPALPAQEVYEPRIAIRAIEPRRFDGTGDISGEDWLEVVTATALANLDRHH